MEKKELKEIVAFTKNNDVVIKMIDKGTNRFSIQFKFNDYVFCWAKQKRNGNSEERIFKTLDAAYGVLKEIRNSGISIHSNVDNPFNL